MYRAALAIAGLVSVGACSTLLTPSGSAATRWAALEKSRAEAATKTSERKICKNMPVMGSHFPEKVCSTQAEWDAFDEQTRQSADQFDSDRRSGRTEGAFERQQ